MPKRLSERIKEQAELKEAPQRQKNFAAFLSQKEEIRQSLEDGWSVLQIWKTLKQEGKITTTYAAFSRQVRRAFLSRNIGSTEPAKKEVSAPKEKPQKKEEFAFNPIPNKDLY